MGSLLVSVDEFNHGPAGLVVLLPLTSRDKGIPWHVEITPTEGGLKKVSYIKREDIRSITYNPSIRGDRAEKRFYGRLQV